MRNTALRGGMLPFFILVFFTLSILPVCGQSEQSAYEEKTVMGSLMLQDHVEILSSASTIINMGLTGKGTTIAVVSTGINRGHEQFGGRVIAENCFDSSKKCIKNENCEQDCEVDDEACFDKCYICSTEYHVCGAGELSYPENAQTKALFDRGSHLTGIAAGEDGIAPKANIVSVNIQSEYSVGLNNGLNRAFMEEKDLKNALNWLLEIQDELKKNGNPISVVDIDFSSGSYETNCDTDPDLSEFFEIFQEMRDAGMIPVAPAGDHIADGEISFPACLSNVMAVGALAGMDEPIIVSFSDHSELVDIVAPGTEIYSAYLVNMDDMGNVTCTENCYGYMTGTSQAASMVSGSLALLMQAFPGKTQEEYIAMLTEMSTKTVDRRNSNDQSNTTSDDLTGTWFNYVKPILDFSDFTNFYRNKNLVNTEYNTVVINDQLPQSGSGPALYGDIHTQNKPGIKVVIDSEKDPISTGNITAQGPEADGIDAIVISEKGSQKLMVWDNVTAGNAGIVVYKENKGDLDILVPGTIQGGTVGILVKEEFESNGVPKAGTEIDTGSYNHIRVTAGEIKLNQNGNAAEFEDGSKVAELENDINYIIYMDQPDKGKIEIVSGARMIHGYPTAKKGERVYFKASADFTVYNRKTNKALPRTDNGLFYMDVPNGGPVHVFAISKWQSNSIEFFPLPEYFMYSDLPRTGFSAQGTQDPVSQPLKVDYTPANLTLQLPTLSVRSDILIVPEADGEYPVEWLGDLVGMLEGSSRPGEGVIVLTGHNHLNASETGPFVALGALEEGDRIFLTDEDTLYLYEVTGNYKIEADDFLSIAGDLNENTLVLITCEDESMYGGYINRRVIFAEPV